MGPRSALPFVSFAAALCVVRPGFGDEPAELPLPPPVVSAAATAEPVTAPAPVVAPSAPGPASGPGGPAPDVEAIALAKKRASVRRSGWSRDTSLGAIVVGGSLVGAGWVLSVIHGLVGEVAGVDCKKASGGYTATLSCADTDDYGPIFIPVVGPFVEAASHNGTLSDADKGFLAVEGILQAGGLITALVGLATLPASSSSRRAAVTLTPVVTARGASLGLTGSF
jgi:hypothetical protein